MTRLAVILVVLPVGCALFQSSHPSESAPHATAASMPASTVARQEPAVTAPPRHVDDRVSGWRTSIELESTTQADRLESVRHHLEWLQSIVDTGTTEPDWCVTHPQEATELRVLASDASPEGRARFAGFSEWLGLISNDECLWQLFQSIQSLPQSQKLVATVGSRLRAIAENRARDAKLLAKRMNDLVARLSGQAVGLIRFNVTPWASVELDGEAIGETPMGPRSVSPGKHQIILKNLEMRKTVTVSVDVTAGQEILIKKNLEEDVPQR